MVGDLAAPSSSPFPGLCVYVDRYVAAGGRAGFTTGGCLTTFAVRFTTSAVRSMDADGPACAADGGSAGAWDGTPRIRRVIVSLA